MRAAIVVCLAWSFAVHSPAEAATYINPLQGDISVHDPCIIFAGGTYYVYGTGTLIPYKTSADRITWKNRGSVFSSGFSWFKTYVPANDGSNIWAPDISFRNSMFWLYYAVSTSGKRISAIGLATSPTLDPSAANYKWTDQGMVIWSDGSSSENYNCIDPNAFSDTDNTVWLVFGSWWDGIKLVQLDPQTGKPASVSPPLISLAKRTSSKGIEAPFIIYWKGYYYLFVSFDVCCNGVNSTYKIVVGRASKLSGPFADKTGTAMLSGGGTYLDTGDARWKGPGGQSILIEKDSVFVINHTYDANNNGTPTMQIRPLYFDINHWPTFTPQPVGVLPGPVSNITAMVPAEQYKKVVPGIAAFSSIVKNLQVNQVISVFDLSGKAFILQADKNRMQGAKVYQKVKGVTVIKIETLP
jgi:Beta-xylosidase